MVKLNLCFVAAEVRNAISEGRRNDAVAIAAAHLRKGYASEQFQAVVAELLAPKKRKRGAPKKQCPPYWYEIGLAFEERRDAGFPHEYIVAELANRFGQSDRSIRKAVAFFRKHDGA